MFRQRGFRGKKSELMLMSGYTILLFLIVGYIFRVAMLGMFVENGRYIVSNCGETIWCYIHSHCQGITHAALWRATTTCFFVTRQSLHPHPVMFHPCLGYNLKTTGCCESEHDIQTPVASTDVSVNLQCLLPFTARRVGSRAKAKHVQLRLHAGLGGSPSLFPLC